MASDLLTFGALVAVWGIGWVLIVRSRRRDRVVEAEWAPALEYPETGEESIWEPWDWAILDSDEAAWDRLQEERARRVREEQAVAYRRDCEAAFRAGYEAGERKS